LGDSALVGKVKDETPRRVEEKRRNTEGLKILFTKPTEDINENKEDGKISRGVTFGKNYENELPSPDYNKPVSPRSRSAEINNEDVDRTLIETFGALHSDSTTEIDKPPNWMQFRNRLDRVGSIDENMKASKEKLSSVEDSIDKKTKSRLKVVSSPDTLSPKRIYNKPSSLKPPEYKKEDSSPKVKSNFSNKRQETESSENWGTLVNQQIDGDKKTPESSSKPYVGDIPKIVIHGEKGNSKVLDFGFLPKAMSLGILDGDVKYSPLNDKNASRGFSMALNDIDSYDAGDDEWAKFKASQKKEKERIENERKGKKKEVSSSKDSVGSEKRNSKNYEKGVKEVRNSLILMEAKSPK